MTVQDLYRLFRQYPTVSTDTRAIKSGSLFFALKGERFDGNKFAEQALEAGASHVVVDDPQVIRSDDPRYVIVPDVLKALQELAAFHRQHLQIPVVGLTGSNGKTTTKELIKAVLGTSFNVHATVGNLNNHIGVPLTLLGIGSDVEVAIIEMGANHVSEIAFLCSMATPTHGLITNVGKAHLEGFGSFEGVVQAKSELYAHLASQGGFLFLQADNPELLKAARRFFTAEHVDQMVMTYGPSASNDVSGVVLSADPFLKLQWEGRVVQTRLAGAYNLENVLAAIAVGRHFGLPDELIQAGIEGYTPSNNRSQVVDTAQGNRVIEDFYNANASSMRAAIDNFQQIKDPRPKVLILGDMFELGALAAEEHRQIAEKTTDMGASRIILIGKHFYEVGQSWNTPNSPVTFVPDLRAARSHLGDQPIKDSLVLLKGSRGIALEQLVELL